MRPVPSLGRMRRRFGMGCDGGFAIKICFLMYHGSMESGGQGVYLANVTRELSRLGHDVHVISGPPYAVLDPAVTEHRMTTHSFQSMLLDRNAYFGGAGAAEPSAAAQLL